MLEEKGAVFSAVLGLVDIKRGTNSYYKLQLLEGDSGKGYYLFRSWGRVGTSIGGSKLEVCSVSHTASATTPPPLSLSLCRAMEDLSQLQKRVSQLFSWTRPATSGRTEETPL